jgi:hypothetical protein
MTEDELDRLLDGLREEARLTPEEDARLLGNLEATRERLARPRSRRFGPTALGIVAALAAGIVVGMRVPTEPHASGAKGGGGAPGGVIELTGPDMEPAVVQVAVGSGLRPSIHAHGSVHVTWRQVGADATASAAVGWVGAAGDARPVAPAGTSGAAPAPRLDTDVPISGSGTLVVGLFSLPPADIPRAIVEIGDGRQAGASPVGAVRIVAFDIASGEP